MAISLVNKGRVAIKAQSAWGTAETSFASTDFLEVEAPVMPVLMRETLGVDTFRPDFTAPPRVAGSKAMATMTLKGPLHGWSAATPTNNPTIHPDATILRAILGGGAALGYSTAATGGTAALATFSTIPTTFAGYASLFPTAGAGVIGWHNLVIVNTSSAPLVDLDGTPITGTALGSYVVWLAGPETQALPLTLDWLGTDTTARMRYFDGLPSKVTITLAAKAQPMIEVEYVFLNWTAVGSGGAPTGYAYGYPQMPACIGANGFSTRIDAIGEICPTTVVIEITQTLDPADCGSADQGVDSLIASNREVLFTVTRNPTTLGATPWTDAPGTAIAALQVDANTTGGRAFSGIMKAPQVKSSPTPQANGNLLGLSTVYEALLYSGDTGSTAPADIAVAFAFL